MLKRLQLLLNDGLLMIGEILITRFKYGILISRNVIITDYCKIMKAYADEFDIVDLMIAAHTKSSGCLTTKEKSILWRKELGIRD